MADEQEPKTAKTAKETPADKLIRLQLENLERQNRIQEVQLVTAELGLEAARDENERLIADKRNKRMQNKQRQDQLAIDRRGRIGLARQCAHRQGGSPDNQYDGEGDSSLNVVKLPDGFSRLIMCSICRLRVFSAHPRNMAKNLRPGESHAQAKARIEKYHRRQKEFDTLLKMANKKKTKEAKQMMDCGVVMDVIDLETGQLVQRERPCDTYALSMTGILTDIHTAA